MDIYDSSPFWYMILWSAAAGMFGTLLLLGAWELLKALIRPRRLSRRGGRR